MKREAKPVNMEEGEGVQQDVLLIDAPHLDHVFRIMDQVVLTDHRTLGSSGSSRCIDNKARRISLYPGLDGIGRAIFISAAGLVNISIAHIDVDQVRVYLIDGVVLFLPGNN